MTTLATRMFWVFAAGWALTGLIGLAADRLDVVSLGGFAKILLRWGTAQAGFGMALSSAVLLCARAGRPGLVFLGVALVLLCLALAGAGLGPQVAAALPPDVAEAYNALRAALPRIRISGFLGLGLIGTACLFARPRSRIDRTLVRAAILSTAAALLGIGLVDTARALGLLGLPALVVLLLLSIQLSEADRPGAAYAFVALCAVIAGLAVTLLGDGGRRIDLRPSYAALPLLAVAASRDRPAIAPGLVWLHAGAIGALLAVLAHGLPLVAAAEAPTSLGEIRAALARAAQVRTAALWLIVALTLGGLWVIRRRRSVRATGPSPAP